MSDTIALIERLRAHAACHDQVSQYDDDQKQWAEDLLAAADLIQRLRPAITNLRDEAIAAAWVSPPDTDPDGVRSAYRAFADRLDAILRAAS